MFEPFAKCLATSNDYRLKKDVHQNVFTYLIKQSDEALEYEDLDLEKQAVISMSDAKANRKKAKKSKKNRVAVEEESNEEKEEETNPPAETDDEDEEEDAEEAVGEDDMEMEESNFDWGAKDPRAGGVDSIIPQIKPDYNQIADLLFQMASDKSVRAKNRKSIYDIVKKFVKPFKSNVFCSFSKPLIRISFFVFTGFETWPAEYILWLLISQLLGPA